MSTTKTITPSALGSGRESPASVWSALVAGCRDLHGGEWEGYATSDGKLAIKSSLSFAISFADNTKTRLGFTLNLTGSASYTAPNTHGGVYPSGLAMNTRDRQRGGGAFTSDGSGSTPLLAESKGSGAQLLDTWANVNAYQATLYAVGTSPTTADVWIGGRIVGRFAVSKAEISRPGLSPDPAFLNLDLKGAA